jgi:hypothetical protein
MEGLPNGVNGRDFLGGKYGEVKKFERLRQKRRAVLPLKPLKKTPRKKLLRFKENPFNEEIVFVIPMGLFQQSAIFADLRTRTTDP